MIKAVVFDMFETLITHKESIYFGRQMAADAGIPEKDFQEIWHSAEDDRTLGNITFEETITKILRLNNCFSEELLGRIVKKRIASKEECFRHLNPEIIPLLCSLKEKGIKTGLISNCFSEECGVIKNSLLYPYFDAACLSYELGIKKPDVKIFESCVKQLEVGYDECLYVGDGGSYELETADKLGMKAVQALWYIKSYTEREFEIKPDFVHAEAPMDIMGYMD